MTDETDLEAKTRRGVGPRGSGIRRGLLRALPLALALAGTADAQLYYSRDADGTYRFTNAPGPDVSEYVPEGPLADLGPLSRPAVVARPGGLLAPADLEAIIEKRAREAGVELALVKAVIHAESGFDRRAVSPKGARGLMQLMPATARRHGGYHLFDADENVRTGVEHLRMLLGRYGGNLPRTLAAYNAGEGSVARYRGIPPYAETQAYVRRVLHLRSRYLRSERMNAAGVVHSGIVRKTQKRRTSGARVRRGLRIASPPPTLARAD